MSTSFFNLADIMARFENANPAYNNQGGLGYTDFSIKRGAIAKAPNGLAIFPDWSSGRSAQNDLINSYASQGLTVEQMVNKWAPPDAVGNSTESTNNYIKTITDEMGITKDAPVSSASDSSATDNLMQWGQAIARVSTPSITTAASMILGLDVGRWAALILGLILIAGGVMMFKPARDIIVSGAKTATEAAAV